MLLSSAAQVDSGGGDADPRARGPRPRLQDQTQHRRAGGPGARRSACRGGTSRGVPSWRRGSGSPMTGDARASRSRLSAHRLVSSSEVEDRRLMRMAKRAFVALAVVLAAAVALRAVPAAVSYWNRPKAPPPLPRFTLYWTAVAQRVQNGQWAGFPLTRRQRSGRRRSGQARVQRRERRLRVRRAQGRAGRTSRCSIPGLTAARRQPRTRRCRVPGSGRRPVVHGGSSGGPCRDLPLRGTRAAGESRGASR